MSLINPRSFSICVLCSQVQFGETISIVFHHAFDGITWALPQSAWMVVGSEVCDSRWESSSVPRRWHQTESVWAPDLRPHKSETISCKQKLVKALRLCDNILLEFILYSILKRGISPNVTADARGRQNKKPPLFVKIWKWREPNYFLALTSTAPFQKKNLVV